MNIPIVGQGYRPVSFHPLVNLLCDCGPNGDSQLVTIFGINAPAFCPTCKQGYVITGLKDNQATIGKIRMDPQGSPS